MGSLRYAIVALAVIGCADNAYDPNGPAIDPNAPRIHITSPERGTIAGEAQLMLVRGTVSDDSGKVASSAQAYVAYGGPALESQTSYVWTVRTWDRTDQASPEADEAGFDTGLGDADWQASWIRRDSSEGDDYTLARKELDVTASPVLRARAYLAANHQADDVGLGLRRDGGVPVGQSEKRPVRLYPYFTF